ncbi:hypothetical protein V2W45_1348420 [Cenococcum geophilum]
MPLLCLTLAKFLSAHAKDRHTPSAELELAKAKLICALKSQVKELDGVNAVKDSEIARKDREISGLVAVAAKSQAQVQDLEEANATISEFCSTLEETRDSCRATIECWLSGKRLLIYDLVRLCDTDNTN